MTPTEKADDLLARMTVDFSIDAWQSKQCALVAVDEILKALGYEDEFWLRVKKEIENSDNE
jgi:ABC-type proline/glycine betaine transport system substrate-binding protein